MKNSKKEILLVEDDENFGSVLQEYLEIKGDFNVTLCGNGLEGLAKVRSQDFHLAIFDIMMPEMDGFTLAEEVKKRVPNLPLIFASAKSDIKDKKEAFKLGADDYITKPFSIEELLMRINALLKRSAPEGGEDIDFSAPIKLSESTFDYQTREFITPKGPHKLTSKEAELLKMLSLRKNQIVSRQEALNEIWLDDNYFNGRSMDVYLSKIRKLISEDVGIELLNVHGKGYKLIVSQINN